MKWAYGIQEKMKAALLLAIVLVVVFGINMVYRNNVSQLGNSFSSVYEDRLVVESYIYKFSDYLYQKKIMIDDCSNNAQLNSMRDKISLHNEAIRKMIASYEATKLTKDEALYFNAFKKNIDEIMTFEANLLSHQGSAAELATEKPVIDLQLDKALDNLKYLSGIQVAEGKILNDNSKKIMSGSTILTQFELVVLIVIAIMIQVLIFASSSFKPKIPQNHNLN